MYESSVLVIMIFVLMFHLALLGKLYSKEMSVAADLQLHQVCAPSMVSPLPADADGSGSSKEERGRC